MIRRAFTLVELLVVITIIGMLMALLLPAIQQAREAGRRNTCSNNMRNLATALMTNESSARGFPGYANVIGNKRASWIVAILPNLERNDLYSTWISKPATAMSSPFAVPAMNGLPTESPWAHTALALLVCPSSPNNQGTNSLSYVCNTGVAATANDNLPGGGSTWAEDINSGVFFNQARADLTGPVANQNPAIKAAGSGAFQPGGPKMTMDFLSTNDGSSYTLMLSENLQASNWATDPLSTVQPIPDPFQNEFQIRQSTGFVWFLTGIINNAELTPSQTASFDSDGAKINNKAKTVTMPQPLTYGVSGGVPNGGLAYSRPSSSHPGGVNMIFCDGHLRFVADSVPYHVYTQLCTPKQMAVRLNSAGATPQSAGWAYLINETDY